MDAILVRIYIDLPDASGRSHEDISHVGGMPVSEAREATRVCLDKFFVLDDKETFEKEFSLNYKIVLNTPEEKAVHFSSEFCKEAIKNGVSYYDTKLKAKRWIGPQYIVSVIQTKPYKIDSVEGSKKLNLESIK